MTATCLGKFWAVTSFIASVACAVGFYFPFWLRGYFKMAEDDVIPLNFGSFRRCTYPVVDIDGEVVVLDECGRYATFMDIPSLYWQITTIAVGVGTCLALLLSTTALLSLCFRDIVTVKLARFGGLLQLVAGLLVGGGLALYPKGWDSSEVVQACGPDVGPYHLGECSLYWAFYMTAVGGGLTILCSSLVCHSYEQKTHQRLAYDV